uniref:DRMBL domain-containing protein n=1 Tax=Glossina austeni TaxID=7395 RepID=A0A1A9UI39_GLOAU
LSTTRCLHRLCSTPSTFCPRVPCLHPSRQSCCLGWEKNSRPQYRGKINIVGVEYSEHSSFEELKHFVKYLKPHQVISTVAMGRDPLITADVPQNWYKYQELKNSRSYQPIITFYMSIAKPQLRPTAIKNKTKQARSKSLTEESSLAKENISKRDGIDKTSNVQELSTTINKNMSKPMFHAQKIPKNKICRSKSPSESSIPMGEESKEQDVLNVYKNGELKPPAPNDS